MLSIFCAKFNSNRFKVPPSWVMDLWGLLCICLDFFCCLFYKRIFWTALIHCWDSHSMTFFYSNRKQSAYPSLLVFTCHNYIPSICQIDLSKYHVYPINNKTIWNDPFHLTYWIIFWQKYLTNAWNKYKWSDHVFFFSDRTSQKNRIKEKKK